jgi:hypothetical protein
MRQSSRGMTATWIARASAARIQPLAHLLSLARAKVFQPGARRHAMAKGQMRSNKEKKKPKADKNLKKGGATPSPFSSGKIQMQAGQNQIGKK